MENSKKRGKLGLLRKGAVLLATAAAASFTWGCAGQGVSGAEEADGKINIKIAHGSAESHHLHRTLEKFGDLIEETGKFQVEIYPSQQFGSDGEMIEAVKTGDLTMAVSPTSYLPEECPSMSMIELPYVYPDKETAVRTLEGEWGQAQLQKLEDSGLHGLGYLDSGMRQLTNDKKEIHTPEDLDGMKIRTMQVEAHVEFWNSMGCSAEGSPFSELYTNLSTGVFDGEENPIAQIYAQKFYEVQKYITISDHVYTAYIPVVTTDFWNGLSEEEQGILTEAFEEARSYQMELVDKEEAEELSEIEEAGCVVNVLTEDEKAAFIEAAAPTLEKYREKIGAEVYDEFMAAVEAASETE